MSRESLGAQTFRGSFFSIGAAAITVILGFVRSILLARLLLPEDFGLVTLALFFVSLTGSIRDFGFSNALIHREDNIETAASTYFVLRLILAGAVFGLTVLAIPLLQAAYPDQPLLIPVLLMLSAAQILRAINSTPDIILRKALDFKYLSLLDVLSSLAMTIIAPAMAFAGLGLWSLVAEQIVPIVVRSLGLWGFRRPWRLSFHFDPAIARWFFKFGSFVFASITIVFFLDQFDDFWTGTALGVTALGFYSRAYEFARYPRRVIGMPITRVFFPAYARLQHDRERLSKAYYRAGSLIIRAGFLFSLAFALVAPEFIRLFIGEKWLPMLFTFRLMLFYTLLDPLLLTSDHLLTAAGYPQRLTQVRAAQLVIFVPLVILLAHFFGINGVAMAANLMLVAGMLIMVFFLRPIVDVPWLRMFLAPGFAFILAGLGTLLAVQYFNLNSDIARLLLKAVLAGGLYSILLVLLEFKNFRDDAALIRQFLRR